jgi:hypothetical protein
MMLRGDDKGVKVGLRRGIRSAADDTVRVSVPASVDFIYKHFAFVLIAPCLGS